MSFITGVGLTSYGKHEGSSSLDLMSKAAELAIADAGLKRSEIDGILCGYQYGLAAHHAGDRIRRALWHSAILRACRAGRRGDRSRHDHAGASPGRRRRRKTCAGGRRRKSSHRAEPRCLDPGAGAGRSPRLRGDPGADDPRLLRSRRIPLHARIWRHPGRSRRIRGADARPRLDPSRRAVPRADHRRRRDGLKAGGDAAQAAGLLPGIRRRRGVRDQPRADLRRPAFACAARRRRIPISTLRRRLP